MYRVASFGEDSGEVYVYRVDAPKGAHSDDVAAIAYREHGSRLRAGWVKELLADLYTVTWDDPDAVM